MKYQELMSIIGNSDYNDWLYNDGLGIHTYKEDLNIWIKREDLQDEFVEDWATNHPDKNAKRLPFSIFYGSTFVSETYTALVDGGKAIIPYPDDNLIIHDWEYNFGLIINRGGEFDEYLKKCGIEVE